MSFTLNNLKATQRALLDDNIPKAIHHINLLIARMETILHMRKNWKPKCGLLQELNSAEDNRRA